VFPIKNVVFSRIDERLLHGQVVTAWVADAGCNEIYVVDDATAKNTMIRNLYRKLAPTDTKCDVVTVEQAITLLSGEPGSEKIMLLVKVPQTLEALVEGGIELTRINLGGMGLNKSRKPFVENVSASPEEIDSMKRMLARGIAITYQMSPHSPHRDVRRIIEKQGY